MFSSPNLDQPILSEPPLEILLVCIIFFFQNSVSHTISFLKTSMLPLFPSFQWFLPLHAYIILIGLYLPFFCLFEIKFINLFTIRSQISKHQSQLHSGVLLTYYTVIHSSCNQDLLDSYCLLSFPIYNDEYNINYAYYFE